MIYYIYACMYPFSKPSTRMSVASIEADQRSEIQRRDLRLKQLFLTGQTDAGRRTPQDTDCHDLLEPVSIEQSSPPALYTRTVLRAMVEGAGVCATRSVSSWKKSIKAFHIAAETKLGLSNTCMYCTYIHIERNEPSSQFVNRQTWL